MFYPGQNDKYNIMTNMTIETLRKISDKIPGEYDVIFETPTKTIYPISDKFEVDVEHKRVIFKK